MANVELQFNEPQGLQAWLRERPRKVAVVIAARTALRVLPLVRSAVPDGKEAGGATETFVLSTFRSALVSWVAATYPARGAELGDAAAAAAAVSRTAADAGDRAATHHFGVAPTGARAAAAAARAAARAGDDNAAAAVAAAADAAYAAGAAAAAAARVRFADVGSAKSKSVWISISDDASAAAAGIPPSELAVGPLWSDPAPDWPQKEWVRLKDALLGLSQGWEVWTDWYDARLYGRPNWPDLSPKQNEELDVAVATLPDELWQHGPVAVNHEIKRLINSERGRGGRSVVGNYGRIELGPVLINSTDTTPVLPEARPGAAFRETPAGLVEIAPTGLLTPEDDAAALERARIDVIDVLDDLSGAIGQSNAFQFVKDIADKYRAALEGPMEQVAFDTVWRRGVRLRGAHVRLQRDIQNGELPEMAADVEEALSSVVALHGPMVLSTKAGREQANLARLDRGEIDQWLEHRDKLREFAERSGQADRLLTGETAEEIQGLADNAGEGPDVARSVEASVALEESLLIWLGNRILAEFQGSPVRTTVAATAGAGILSPLALSAATFLSANADFLIGFSACSQEYLYWIPEYLRWLKRQLGLIA